MDKPLVTYWPVSAGVTARSPCFNETTEIHRRAFFQSEAHQGWGDPGSLAVFRNNSHFRFSIGKYSKKESVHLSKETAEKLAAWLICESARWPSEGE